jgi:hypothetical protein
VNISPKLLLLLPAVGLDSQQLTPFSHFDQRLQVHWCAKVLQQSEGKMIIKGVGFDSIFSKNDCLCHEAAEE